MKLYCERTETGGEKRGGVKNHISQWIFSWGSVEQTAKTLNRHSRTGAHLQAWFTSAKSYEKHQHQLDGEAWEKKGVGRNWKDLQQHSVDWWKEGGRRERETKRNSSRSPLCHLVWLWELQCGLERGEGLEHRKRFKTENGWRDSSFPHTQWMYHMCIHMNLHHTHIAEGKKGLERCPFSTLFSHSHESSGFNSWHPPYTSEPRIWHCFRVATQRHARCQAHSTRLVVKKHKRMKITGDQVGDLLLQTFIPCFNTNPPWTFHEFHCPFWYGTLSKIQITLLHYIISSPRGKVLHAFLTIISHSQMNIF